MLCGNLTRDPELKYTANNVAVCKIGLAVNEKWKGADGELHEEVCFVDCVVFGPRGEVINKYFTKGKPILITDGKLKLNSWEDKEGNKRSKLEVIISDFEFVGGDKTNSTKTNKSSKTSQKEPVVAGVGEDDIPF